MKKRSMIEGRRILRHEAGESLLTGEHCPSSGWWAAEVELQAVQFISEGSLMPAIQGAAVSGVRLSGVLAGRVE